MNRVEEYSVDEHVDWMAEVFCTRAIDINTEDPEWVAAGQQFTECYAQNRQALWDAIHTKTCPQFLPLMTRMFEMDKNRRRASR